MIGTKIRHNGTLSQKTLDNIKTGVNRRLNARQNKKPELNDEIIHTEYTYNRVNQGKVIQLLDMQFLYQMKDGAIRHCMFDEDWRFVADGKTKKETN